MRRKEFENITGRFYMENILEISKLNVTIHSRFDGTTNKAEL